MEGFKKKGFSVQLLGRSFVVPDADSTIEQIKYVEEIFKGNSDAFISDLILTSFHDYKDSISSGSLTITSFLHGEDALIIEWINTLGFSEYLTDYADDDESDYDADVYDSYKDYALTCESVLTLREVIESFFESMNKVVTELISCNRTLDESSFWSVSSELDNHLSAYLLLALYNPTLTGLIKKDYGISLDVDPAVYHLLQECGLDLENKNLCDEIKRMSKLVEDKKLVNYKSELSLDLTGGTRLE
ncbi:MAG: hypothetical protein IBX55_00535 [Methyloprofundus sp.]|nr:hypothetical protein [Methyloprofundus sp.]